MFNIVIPAQAGIQRGASAPQDLLKKLDSRLRGNDKGESNAYGQHQTLDFPRPCA